MNKSQYRSARALMRANGNFALRWLEGEAKAIMTQLASQKGDRLKNRYIYCSAMEPMPIKLAMIKSDILWYKS